MRISPDTQKAATGFVVAMILVFSVAAWASTARADTPQPTKADYEHLANIKANQKVIEKNRAAHELFLQAKDWNESENEALAKNGWCVNWQTMKLEQCPSTF